MQARAIFEAACEAAKSTGQPVRPEIMIPLVSAVRELELLKRHIESVAAEVRTERGEMVDYHVGVMIETPRAALRAGDIADSADFLSFGTNDLTQMVYGLSRDDAGRFIPDYVAQQVYLHDPFHTLDREGVGEIMWIATERARAHRPNISIGLCGEHGGDPASVRSSLPRCWASGTRSPCWTVFISNKAACSIAASMKSFRSFAATRATSPC
jgi:pyruvate,orthophosphate dikinase